MTYLIISMCICALHAYICMHRVYAWCCCCCSVSCSGKKPRTLRQKLQTSKGSSPLLCRAPLLCCLLLPSLSTLTPRLQPSPKPHRSWTFWRPWPNSQPPGQQQQTWPRSAGMQESKGGVGASRPSRWLDLRLIFGHDLLDPAWAYYNGVYFDSSRAITGSLASG